MNSLSLNDVKYLDLPITLAGGARIEIDSEDFNHMIFSNLKAGTSYLVHIVHNGISLSIDGEDTSPLVFTIPEYPEHFAMSALRLALEQFIRDSDIDFLRDYDLNLSLMCLKLGI